MAHLKLRTPEQLPAHGLTLQQFKLWKNHLRNYLRQDTDNSQFFPGRLYATWQSQEDHEDRLQALHAQDLEAARLHKRPNIQPAQLERDLTDLLERRNAQLAKFLSLITMLCHYTEQDQIDQRATSLEWIFTFIEQKYNLSNKGANFLKIAGITYTQGTPYDAFYKQLRSAVGDSLLRQSDVLLYRDNHALEEDERFSPTLENVVVLWALQLINHRLPNQVHKTFGHQLKNNVRLIDLHQQIFDQIPELLQDIEVTESNRASALQAATATDDFEPSLNAIFPHRGSLSRAPSHVAGETAHTEAAAPMTTAAVASLSANSAGSAISRGALPTTPTTFPPAASSRAGTWMPSKADLTWPPSYRRTTRHQNPS